MLLARFAGLTRVGTPGCTVTCQVPRTFVPPSVPVGSVAVPVTYLEPKNALVKVRLKLAVMYWPEPEKEEPAALRMHRPLCSVPAPGRFNGPRNVPASPTR